MKKILIPIISILIAFGLTSLVLGFVIVSQTKTVTQTTTPTLTPIPSNKLEPEPEIYAEDLQSCEVSFVLAPLQTASPSPSPSPTVSPTATATVHPTATPSPTPSPSPTVQAGCYQVCSISVNGESNCPNNLACTLINGQYKCANTTCPQSQSCTCSSPSPTPTQTPAPTSTATPKPGCYDRCSANSDCPDDLLCRNVNGNNRCVNVNCTGESDCTCSTTSPKEPELPKAGGIPPTVIFALGGILIVLLGLIF